MADTQFIGVAARFDVTQFNVGFRTYVNALRTVDQETNRATRSVSTAGTAIAAGFGSAIGVTAVNAVQRFIGSLRELINASLATVQEFERLQFSFQTLAAIELANARGTNVASQLEAGQDAARGYLEVIKQLAIFSPFTTTQIAEGNRLLQVYGFLGDEALRLTTLLVDFGSGAGLDTELLNRISLAIGQIRAEGRLLARDQLQLSQAGIPLLQILADYTGQSTQELQDLQRKGAIPATIALEALTEWLEQFEGSGRRVAGTFRGLLSSLEDLRQISQRNFFAGVFEPLLPVLQQIVDTVNTPEIQAGLTILGEIIGTQLNNAIAFLRTQVTAFIEAWSALDPVIQRSIIVFTGVVIALTAFVGTLGILGTALTLIINPFTVLASVIAGFVAAYTTNIGGIRTATQTVANGINTALNTIVTGFNNTVNAVLGSSNTMAQAFANLASQAVQWGMNIVNSLAQGVIGAIDVVVQAVSALGQVLAYWMAPGSPPRFLPDLELWGTGAAEAYLEGWNKASFDAIGEFGDQFRGILNSFATIGRIDEIDVPRILEDIRNEFAFAVDDIIKFGEITELTFNRIVEAAGPIGQEAAQFTQVYARYTAEIIKQSKAQEELNRLTAQYDAILAPLERRLRQIQNERSTGDETLELRQLQRVLTNRGVSDVRKQIAAARIEEIKLQQQIRNVTEERDEQVALQEDAVREAEAALVPLREELELYKARFKVAEDQYGLFADQERILDSIKSAAGGVKAALDDVTNPLKDQLRAIQLQQEELRDLKEAAKARAILEDENATAAQKAAAQLKLQEISIRQQLRDIEAAELGVNLEQIRQIPIVLADLESSSGAGAGAFDGLAEGFELASGLDVEGLTAEWDEQLEESRENFREWGEGIKTTFQEIEDSLPSFLSLQQNAEGTVPAIESLKDAFAILAATLASSRISAAIYAIAAALGISLGPWVAVIIGAVALLGAAWARNWFNIRDVTQQAVTSIQEFFQNLTGGEGLQGVIDNFQQWFQDIRQQFTLFVQNLPQTLAALPTILGEAMAKGLAALIIGVATWAATLTSWAGPAFAQLITNLATGLGNTIQWILGTFIPGVISAFNTLLQEFGPFGVGLLVLLVSFIIQAGSAFVTKISEYGPEISTAIAGWATSIGTAFTAHIFPAFAAALVIIGTSIVDGLASLLGPEAVQPVITAFSNIATLLSADNVKTAFTDAAVTIMTGVISSFNLTLTEGGATLLQSMLALPGVFLSAGPVTTAWTTAAASLMFSVILRFINTLTEQVGQVRQKVIDMASSVFSGETIATWVTSATGLGRDIIGGIISGITERAEDLKGSIQDSVTGALDALKAKLGISSPSKFAKDELGVPIAEGIEEGTEEFDSTALFELLQETLIAALTSIKDSAVELAGLTSEGVVGHWQIMVKTVNALTSLFITEQFIRWTVFYQQRLSNTQTFATNVENLYRTLYQIMGDLTQEVADLIVEIFDIMAEAVIDIFNAMANQVEEILSDLVSTVQSKLDELRDDLKEFVQDLVDSLEEDFADAGEDLGEAFGEGIAEGIRNAIEEIEQAARDAAGAAEDAAKDESDIASPSRKAANEIGYPFAQGIAEGIRQGTFLIRGAASDAMTAAVTAVLAQFGTGSLATPQTAAAGVTNRTNYYNLNLVTNESSGNILSDFAFMEMMGAR